MSDRLMVSLARALEGFEASDVSVERALAYGWADLPHLELLALRGSPSLSGVAAARAIVAPHASAWLEEAFVARPLDALGLHAEAFDARVAILPATPRWELLVSHTVLTGIARSALALARADVAEVALQRALRFDPLEPRALGLLARALDARPGDAPARAAALRAYLWDAAYDATVLAGAPSDADRVADPHAPDLTLLEPMSLDDQARYAVFSLHDHGIGDSLTGVVRHALTLLRAGFVAQAWAHLYALRNWKRAPATLMGWLGAHVEDDARDRQRGLLREEVERLPAGALAVTASRKQAPNPAGVFEPTRVEGVNAAPAEAVVPALLDGFVEVRLAARKRLADHPLTVAAARIEVGLPELTPLYSGPDLRLGRDQQRLVGVWAPGWAPGIAPAATELHQAIYAQGARDGRPPAAHSFLSFARAAKPACKACKAPFSVGETQLRMRNEYDRIDDAKPLHLRCATKPAAVRALAEARARWRHAV